MRKDNYNYEKFYIWENYIIPIIIRIIMLRIYSGSTVQLFDNW